MKIVVKTFKGLEDVLAEEIRELGGQKVVKLKRAVQCQGDMKLVYRLNLRLRTGLNVLLPYKKWQALNYKEIYEGAKKIEWDQLFSQSQTFALKVTSYSQLFQNSQYSLQRIKDGIVDYFRDKYGSRPDVDRDTPDILIHVYINEKYIEVQLDSSGELLYKRGYEKDRVDAPMNEILVAGLIKMSGWKPDQTFYDPMCGSGTFVLEGLSMATQRDSQKMRSHFAFMNWRNFDQAIWSEVKNESSEKPLETKFYGSDVELEAIEYALKNYRNAAFEKNAYFWRSDFFKVFLGATPGHIFINPPYNQRLSLTQAKYWYVELGKVLKRRYKGWKICIISADVDSLKHIGLKPDKKVPLHNGGLDVLAYFISIFP